MDQSVTAPGNQHPLAHARAQRGWTQDRLAAELRSRGRVAGVPVATSKKTVARWEHSVRPDHVTQLLLAQVLGVDANQVEALTWPHWIPVTAIAGVKQAWDSESAFVEALDEVFQASLDRRSFLGLSGFALQKPLYEWLTSVSPELQRGLAGARVDDSTFDTIDQLIASSRALGERYGGGVCLGLDRGNLDAVMQIIKTGNYGDRVGLRLFAVAAEIAQQAAWVCFDVGRHAAAQQYWFAAVRLAHRAGNRPLGANAVSFLSYQAYSLGSRQDANWLIDFVLERVRPEMTPKLVAHVHGRKALAASMTGEVGVAERAIGRALESVQDPTAGEPSWTSWIDEAQVHGMAGRALLGLEVAGGAEEHLTHAIRLTLPRSRSQALYMGQLAQAALLDHDLERASTHALGAYDIAIGVESPRVHGQIRSLREQMGKHAGNAHVREFHDFFDSHQVTQSATEGG